MKKALIKEISCEHCKNNIEKILAKLDYSKNYKVSISEKSIYFSESLDINILEKNLKLEGYHISLIEDVKDIKENKVKKIGFFRKLIEKIGDSNSQNFGNKKLDCCNIQNKK